jgi:hypothetical protein
VNAIVSHGLVVVGARDTDSDGISDLGYASLYSSSGNLMSEFTVSSPGEARFLNRVAMVGDSAFIACGAARPSGIERPFLLRVNLKSPGTIEAAAEATLSGLTGSFSRLVLLAPPALEVALAAISVDGTSRKIHGLRAPWPAFEPVAVEWTQAIAPPSGAWIQLGDLAESGGNLYLVGAARDNGRPVDDGGNPWASGVAASYTSAGDPRWIKTINISQYSDQLFAVAVGPTAIYAVGNAAFYIHANTDLFGYGLVAKLNPDDGHTIATFTAGDERYSSGFNAAEWTGGALVCGGWTLDDLRTGPYRGWLSTLDVSGTSPAAAVRSPIAGAARAVAAELEFGPGRASESR